MKIFILAFITILQAKENSENQLIIELHYENEYYNKTDKIIDLELTSLLFDVVSSYNPTFNKDGIMSCENLKLLKRPEKIFLYMRKNLFIPAIRNWQQKFNLNGGIIEAFHKRILNISDEMNNNESLIEQKFINCKYFKTLYGNYNGKENMEKMTFNFIFTTIYVSQYTNDEKTQLLLYLKDHVDTCFEVWRDDCFSSNYVMEGNIKKLHKIYPVINCALFQCIENCISNKLTELTVKSAFKTVMFYIKININDYLMLLYGNYLFEKNSKIENSVKKFNPIKNLSCFIDENRNSIFGPNNCDNSEMFSINDLYLKISFQHYSLTKTRYKFIHLYLLYDLKIKLSDDELTTLYNMITQRTREIQTTIINWINTVCSNYERPKISIYKINDKSAETIVDYCSERADAL